MEDFVSKLGGTVSYQEPSSENNKDMNFEPITDETEATAEDIAFELSNNPNGEGIEVTNEEPSEEVVSEEEPQQEEEIEKGSSFKYGNTVEQESEEEQIVYDDEVILNLLSEKLGRKIDNFDSLNEPQQETIELDEELEVALRFKKETGRSLNDYMLYQSLNTSEMDDMNAVQLKYQMDYPELTPEDRELLINSTYKIDESLYDEDEIRLSKIKLKTDASRAKKEIESLRANYLVPEPNAKAQQEQPKESIFNDAWRSEMDKTVDKFTSLEFELGDGNEALTFAVDQKYLKSLKDSNQNVESYLDRYVKDDRSWNHELFNAHKLVIDKIQDIVKEAYKQGVSGGQRKLVETTSNASKETRQNVGSGVKDNSLVDVLKQIKGSSRVPSMRIGGKY